MMKKLNISLAVLLAASLTTGTAFSSMFDRDTSNANPEKFGSKAWINKEANLLQSKARNINLSVLKLSLKAFVKAYQKGLDQKKVLTVIDYSKPSNQRRLWVFDLNSGKTIMNTYVSHGKNSGYLNAHAFSNINGSKKSSLGVFITDAPYYGGHGISLRMRGLEKGINDNAYKRAIVFHGAKYMNKSFIYNNNRSGLSWGCPAVSEGEIKTLVDTIKGNTLVFAYYPDSNWLTHSEYLG